MQAIPISTLFPRLSVEVISKMQLLYTHGRTHKVATPIVDR